MLLEGNDETVEGASKDWLVEVAPEEEPDVDIREDPAVAPGVVSGFVPHIVSEVEVENEI